ncbi:hypothetical protein L3X38_005073 [Prunus dulcis]|uniref:ABC transmembrane type-1 domain-containing protein n=1 Tax=Prunus dulcis TaxID=3755 RepID=A0AAD4ZQ88_PRUDU|nr:hypothetical protein L3X38_005073 [Prunus dulcis]
MSAPRTPHVVAAKWILRYIKGTIDRGLIFTPQIVATHLTAYSDAKWAGCPDSRRSTTGYVITLGTNLISWCSKKQSTVSHSKGVCWTRTAERQTSRMMRIEYFKSVLRQDVGYFDNHDAASTAFQVISTISFDAHLIQDTIAQKIPNCLAQLSSFFISLGVAFSLSWRLTVAALPFSVLFIVPTLGFGRVLKDFGSKSNGAYGVAGGIAEQAISSIRTVYSYVGER